MKDSSTKNATKSFSKWALVLSMALLSSEIASAFVPQVRQTTVRQNSEFPKLFASTLPRKTSEELGSTNDGTKQNGIDALQKLLARQEAEVEETKRLLELYESVDAGNREDLEGDNKAELISIASSVLKGFDYGFQSRSEGPRLDNLQGGNAVFVGYGPPANVLSVGKEQFMRNLNAMRDEYEDEKDIGT